MRQIEDLSLLNDRRPTVLTIGAFDGMHRGHQWLIGQAIDRADRLGAQSLVVTFDPRPQVLLRAGSKQLTDGPEKARLIGELGPDVLALLPFTHDLARMQAESFLLSILEATDLREVWVGADFAFGHNRAGDVNFLIRNGEAYGFAVHVVARQQLAGTPISSSLVRGMVGEGRVREAAVYLGHYPGFAGRVTQGHARGKGMGYPTANIEHAVTQELPATGIYAGFACLADQRLPAAISVGYNPVFGNENLSVEAFILDFEGDLYGREIRVEFVDRIREERNFETVDALVEQMADDVARTRRIVEESARDEGAA